MRSLLGMMLVVGLASACRAEDEPKRIDVEIQTRTEFVLLPLTGLPPTFAAIGIPRVLDPRTGQPVDRSNAELKCNPADIRKQFEVREATVLLGEPVIVTFSTSLVGPGRWDEAEGGNYRGLGRDGNYHFLIRHQDGTWVPDIYEGHTMMAMGGMMGYRPVELGKPYVNHLAVQQYCAIDRPGVYDLYAFHWGGQAKDIGTAARIKAALPGDIQARVGIDPDGTLVDPTTRQPSTKFMVIRTTTGDDRPPQPPLADLIPAAVRAHQPNVATASAYAHLTLTVRAGTPAEREAMIHDWAPSLYREDELGSNREDAARNAIALARQADFVPTLETWINQRHPADLGLVWLGLAMRDDPRANGLLFDDSTGRAVRALSFLRPHRVAEAVPNLIDLLCHHQPDVRAGAEDALRYWTGQTFGHTWAGYSSERPTLDEWRAMQAQYRTWWAGAKATFRPLDHPPAP